MIPLLVSEISALYGFCDKQDEEEEVGYTIVILSLCHLCDIIIPIQLEFQEAGK